MSYSESEVNSLQNNLLQRINRSRINLSLCLDGLCSKLQLESLPVDFLDHIIERLQFCQTDVNTISDRFERARAKRRNLESRLSGPLSSKFKPRRPTRIVPNPVDEMMDGSVNETLTPDHPYFQGTPLVYVHGGPSTCIACKETHPCGCDGYLMSDRPSTPAERPAFQSPILDAQAIPEESPLVMTQSDYDRYQQEIAESKEHLCGPDDQSRSAAPSPESLVSDSMKALLDDCVMKK